MITAVAVCMIAVGVLGLLYHGIFDKKKTIGTVLSRKYETSHLGVKMFLIIKIYPNPVYEVPAEIYYECSREEWDLFEDGEECNCTLEIGVTGLQLTKIEKCY